MKNSKRTATNGICLKTIIRHIPFVAVLYEEFKENSDEWDMPEDYYKAAFKKYALKEFYSVMENIFRDGFGTASQTAKDIFSGIKSLIFGGGREK